MSKNPDIKFAVQEKGWMDAQVVQIWIEKIIKPYVADTNAAYLMVDEFSVYKQKQFLDSLAKLGVEVEHSTTIYICIPTN